MTNVSGECRLARTELKHYKISKGDSKKEKERKEGRKEGRRKEGKKERKKGRKEGGGGGWGRCQGGGNTDRAGTKKVGKGEEVGTVQHLPVCAWVFWARRRVELNLL
jgi:hypothetical protein